MSVCAVIVSYYPSVEILENVAALLDQVDEVVIVDNGSGDISKEILGKLSDYPTVRIIYNTENFGIAAALNIGVKYAKDAGYQWLATFDQDSKVTPDIIAKMLQVYNTYPDKGKIASLSPRYQNQSTGKIATSASKKSACNTSSYVEVLVVMTSGNLLKMSTFNEVGYFNEDLFIDHVDNEFCLRCAAHGYKILEVQDAILLHCIGFPIQHRILWALKTTTNHSSLRRYYVARNAVFVYKKFVFIYPAWVLSDAYKFLKLVIMLVLFEKNRFQKVGAIIKGVWHGLLGQLGKFNG